MWTVGIDIATQQAMLASDSITVSALVVSRRSTRGGGALTWLRRSAAPISMRSQISASAIAAAVNMPTAIWLERQPDDCMPNVTSGGPILPPIQVPLAAAAHPT